jgi:hypothetical protein
MLLNPRQIDEQAANGSETHRRRPHDSAVGVRWSAEVGRHIATLRYLYTVLFFDIFHYTSKRPAKLLPTSAFIPLNALLDFPQSPDKLR